MLKTYNWQELSIAYIFGVVQHKRFLKNMEAQLHPESRSYLNYVLSVLHQYKSFPTFLHLQQQFNLHYEYSAIPEFTLEELADKIRLEKTKYDAMETIAEVQKCLTTEGMTIQDFLKPLIRLQERTFNADATELHRLSEYRSILRYYREQGGERVCGFGLPTLDTHTGGISKGDYIVVYANTSQGKSTLTRHIAGNIASQGKVVLYITLEERGRKSVLKTLSTQIREPFDPLINTSYGIDTYKKLENFNVPGDVVFLDRLETGSIPEIARYAYEIEPDVIVVDQIPHLIKPGKQALWETVTHVSSQLRQFGQNNGIPIIALTQANRMGKKKGATMEDSISMAYSQAQDASILIFLHPDEPGPGYILKRLSLLKNRDKAHGQMIDLRWELNTGIIEEEVLTTDFYTGGIYAPTTTPNTPVLSGQPSVTESVPNTSHPQPLSAIIGASVGAGETPVSGIQQPTNPGGYAVRSDG